MNTKALVGPGISGKKLRLGLQNTGNDITTFEAIGQASSTNLNFTGAPTASVTNSANVDEFVVRTSKPVVSQNSVPTKLTNTTMKLFDMDVTVDGTGSVDLARYVFDVNIAGAASLDFFQLVRDGSIVNSTEVDIYDTSGNDLQPGTGPYLSGTGSYQVVVSMLQADPITGSANLQLKAVVSGVAANDTVSTTLNDDDEIVEASGLDAVANDNTGQIFSTTAVDGIFTSTGTYQSTVAGDVLTSDSFIWSDSSADPHTFSLTDGASSADWTNGYLLDINNLDPVTLAENL